MISKGAIIPTERENGDFISTLFIVPKPNGKFRPVINLKYLNDFVHYDHFKQETFKVVLDLLQANDFLTSVDLKDAYFSVPIHTDYQKYLKFSWKNQIFKFVVLPFGLKSAPFVFTKILKPVYAWFRLQNIRCFYYIDDSLNLHQSKKVCQDNTKTIVQTLESLGFIVNREKSVLIPTQKITFFGFIIDSVQFKIYLTDEKINKIIAKCTNLLEKKVIVVRDLASFIGSVINSFYAVLEAPLYYRNLERDKILGLGDSKNYDNKMSLSEESKFELQWWLNNIHVRNGKSIRPKPVEIICRTDASLLGWGCIDLNSGRHAGGRWCLDELKFSINYLELLAIFYALKSFYSRESDVHIQIQSDNISAITYVNDMGGMASKPLDVLAGDIWKWCLPKKIFLSAVHIPGSVNTSDYYSRNFSNSTEWMLKKSVFSRICKHFFMPDIDLFASRLNNQLDNFVSWFPEPGALYSDAFSISWNCFKPYIFPPFSLIGKVISKLLQDNVEKAILVFPYWTSQPWFPLLLDNMISFPVRLPRHKDLLSLPHNRENHPLDMKMHAVIVSGRRCCVQEFQDLLLTSSWHLGVVAQGNNMDTRGNIGQFGIIQGVQIYSRPLRL